MKGDRMMIVMRAFKYRIYPTIEQEILISKTFGCCRFVFNRYLDEWNSSYEISGKGLNYNMCSSSLTNLKNEYQWLREVDSHALQNSLRDLSDGFKWFFKKQKQHPKFKKKGSKESFTSQNCNNSIYLIDDKHIKLPKLGSIKFANSRKLQGKIISATVSKRPSGKYFVSILCECEVEELSKTNSTVGIDLGLTDFLIMSDGTKIDNPHFNRKLKRKIAREQRKLSRRALLAKQRDKKLSDCSNYQKQKIKVAKLHEKVMNQRLDFEHKLSTEIIKNHDVIGVENLNVKCLLKNHHLAYSISDVSWSEFISMLEYKAEWYGKQFIKVDTFYPSSKLCSCCGTYHKDIVNSLKVRKWTCPDCNTTHDRDVNAAKNIEQEALRISTVGTTGDEKSKLGKDKKPLLFSKASILSSQESLIAIAQE